MPPPKTTTKKHDNRRLNNPFPRAGGGGGGGALRLPHSALLSFASPKLAHAQAFPVGGHFHLRWDPALGGSLSLSLLSAPPSRAPLWRTIPGEAFLSAASVATEAHECRGSFALRDARVSLAVDRQLVERIRTFYRCDVDANTDGVDLLRATSFQQSNETRFPVVVITGLLRAKKKDGKPPCCGLRSAKARAAERRVLSARYWILLEQKSDTQVGFSVRIGDYTWNSNHDHAKPAKPAPRIHRSARWRMALRTTKKKPSVFPTGEEMASLLPQQEAECFEEFNRVFITYESDPDERFYGFGEQFSHMEFKGRRVPVLVQEQGIGRGDQPITFAANLVSYRSGGNWSTTYAPSPYYMTSKMRSLYLEGYDYSMFDLTKRDRVQIQVYGSSVQGRILYGESPTEVIASLTESIGRPPVLPSWIISGAVVGMQGGTDAICRVWNQLQHHDVPVSAFWLQDWVGPRKTAIGSQLWWNWEVDTDHYTGWSDLLRDLRRHNVRTMTYCNPCLVPVDQKPNSRRHLFEEAKKLGILVKDQRGEPYMMPNTAFDVAMLDFTNPEANVWFKKILQEMVDDGVRGWMADFGEGLPLDAQLHSGEDPIAAHNRYPELWAQVNWEFVDEWKSQANEADAEAEDDDGLVFFVRSGFRESARWAMLFWEGDQMVSWQTNDGIKSSVVGLLSGGLSGFPLNHSDVGGYCTVDVPFLRYRRSEELLMRWMEVNAFTVVFRTHEGNKPESNCQFYSNNSTLAHFARCAKMYKAWEFYRIQLVKEASDRGLPVARHLFLHYPEDKHIQRMTYQQFLVGTEILVVPVLDKGKKAVNAYFPVSDGSSWKHIWTGDVYDSPWSRRMSGETLQGFEAEVEAPMGYPAVFVKVASPVGEMFVNNLRDLNVL